MDDFDARRHQDTATIRLSPALVSRLPKMVEPAVHRAVAATARSHADGWVQAVVPIEGLDHAARLFLGFGAEVEVLAPATLRSRIASSVAALAATYAAQ